MSFLLPSIYKPFYINVLFVRSSVTKFFVIIDVYNGIGIYDKENEVYDVGSIKITCKVEDKRSSSSGTITKDEILRIYRDKPLFNTSYRESITTVFTGFSIDSVYIGDTQKLIVEYESPNNEYGVQINRNIKLEVDLQKYDNGISLDPFYLFHGQGSQYNIWYDNDYDIHTNLKDRVKNRTNDFLYYVVNEGFYKYFINPEYLNRANSYVYQSYNNNEVYALSSDGSRIYRDLNPYSVNYNDGDGIAYLPTENEYNKSNGDYCITTPFFRMYPSITSEPKEKQSPFAVRLVEYGSNILLERNIDGYGLTQEKLKYNNFYLIGVKSPLTSLNESDYISEYLHGDSLRPEQDYVTVIEFISRIKVLKEDYNGYLVPEESYEDKYK